MVSIHVAKGIKGRTSLFTYKNFVKEALDYSAESCGVSLTSSERRYADSNLYAELNHDNIQFRLMDEGELVGIVILVRASHVIRGEGWAVTHTFILPEYRKGGHLKDLMEAVETNYDIRLGGSWILTSRQKGNTIISNYKEI